MKYINISYYACVHLQYHTDFEVLWAWGYLEGVWVAPVAAPQVRARASRDFCDHIRWLNVFCIPVICLVLLVDLVPFHG